MKEVASLVTFVANAPEHILAIDALTSKREVVMKLLIKEILDPNLASLKNILDGVE